MSRLLLVTLSTLAFCAACATASPPSTTPSTPSSAAPSTSELDVEVVGAPTGTNHDVIAIVDSALRKNGKLGAEADLSAGLQHLAPENQIRITVRPDGHFVEITPRSGAGHDVSLRVDPATLTLHDVAVGEVEPAPE